MTIGCLYLTLTPYNIFAFEAAAMNAFIIEWDNFWSSFTGISVIFFTLSGV